MPNRLRHVLRGRSYHNQPLRTALVLLALLIILSKLVGHRAAIVNTSPSVAPGLYVRSSAEPAVGQIVDFCIPRAARDYVSARTGHTGENWYILKPIVAGPGDRVDTTGDWLVINRRQIAPMPPMSDRDGRPLPRWRANRLLGPGEFFVFSARIPNSFDSRCYGPIKRNEIASVRRPLLTW
ncbi:MAG TPA: S26 family signal peptidase [Tepidisphaeraceae bacterium]|nr:S26 family signal peptidase [Tepidisphaeraceae bacterium]